MTPHTAPPRLVVRLIEWRFTPDEAEAILGDLTEEMAAHAARRSAASARWWYWRQACWAMLSRRRAGAPSPAGRGGSSGLWQDVRLAFRTLRKAPAFSVAVIGTLALTIGAAGAVGTAASRVLLRPLPFPNGARLVIAGHPNVDGIGNVGFETALDWRARMRSFDALALMRSWEPTLVTTTGAVRLSGVRVSWNYFQTLGVRPALGNDFSQDDDTPDRWRVVMLSDGLWRRRFGASPSVVGSIVDFNGGKYRVAGVLPASFEPLVSEHFYHRAEIWALIGYAAGGDSTCRTCQHLHAIARLAPSATLETARAELASVHAGLRAEHPADYKADAPRVEMLQTVIAAPMRQPLAVLAAAVAFVLLVACANIAGLLLTRAADREREMTLRAALGASRLRLVRQLLVEAGVIAAAAVALGVTLARVALGLLADRAPVAIPRIDGAAADPWLFVVAGGVSLVVLAGCGLLPALAASRVNLESTLRQTRQTSSRQALLAREALLVVQVGAALLVAVGGGLMYRTVGHLLDVDPGFRTDHVLTAGLSLAGPRWIDDADVRAFQRDLLARVRSLPGVQSAALAGQVPLGGDYDQRGFKIVGRPLPDPTNEPEAERYSVTPDYFRALGIPLKAGRLLSDADRFGAEPVVVISEATAARYFPGEWPLGQVLQFGSDARPRPMKVVGVVGDVRHYALSEPPRPQFYATQEQFTDSDLTLVMRADDPDRLAAAIAREVTAVAADVPVFRIARFDALVSQSIGTRRFLMLLLAGLGAITLVLAGVGLYGVVSQTVAARGRELGIRVALGASGGNVLGLVARRGIALVAIGAAAGLASALALGQLIQAQLFEVAPADPMTLAGATGVLIAVAIAAHVAPLRRALKADPRETLRAD